VVVRKLFCENKKILDTIYFGSLVSKCRSIKHSGDDLTGDLDGDDGLDNEIIEIDLPKLAANVKSVAVVLNSFSGQDFQSIPFASLRLYEGTPTRVDSVVAEYNIANNHNFNGKVSMVLGVLYRHGTAWKFKAVGESTSDRKLENTLQTVQQSYL
jgi:tellurium resistance protein TerZ